MIPKISVIVPVYNVSAYIEQCLTSLMNQTLKEIEIIVVDDCGTDDSIKKAEKLAKNDARIKIIHHAHNQGLAETRNTGLKYVHTPYVAFLDSDDWVAADYYEKLYSAIKTTKADIAISDVLYYHQKQQTLTREWVSTWNFKLNKKIITNPKDKQYNIYACACWNKLYKTDLFTKNDLKFPKGLKIEDVPITCITTVLANKLVLVEEAKLFYRQRNDSIIKQSNKNRTPFDIFKIYDYTDDLLNQIQLSHNLHEVYTQILNHFKIFNIYAWYNTTHKCFKNEFWDQMKQTFSKINIYENSFMTDETKEIWARVVMNEANPILFSETTVKLFNFIPIIRSIIRTNTTTQKTRINTYLFNYLLIDRIKIKKNCSYHYLFGFIPFLKVKVK